jgi:hypothetical protein
MIIGSMMSTSTEHAGSGAISTTLFIRCDFGSSYPSHVLPWRTQELDRAKMVDACSFLAD